MPQERAKRRENNDERQDLKRDDHRSLCPFAQCKWQLCAAKISEHEAGADPRSVFDCPDPVAEQFECLPNRRNAHHEKSKCKLKSESASYPFPTGKPHAVFRDRPAKQQDHAKAKQTAKLVE